MIKRLFSRLLVEGNSLPKAKKTAHMATLFLVATTLSRPVIADENHRTYAYKAYQRIVGVNPTAAQLDEMENLLREGKYNEAFNVAIESNDFYDVRLSPWIKYWFNENDTNRVDLDDGVATVIGVIRDDLPFNTILTEDILYVGNNQVLPANQPLPDAAVDNNNHYREIETRGLSLKDTLTRTTQSGYYGINAEEQEIAGVFTTRAFANAYYIDGTNRAAFKYTMKHFLCKDMEDLHDTSTPTFRIRQDVTRAPAGEPETFVNTCQGCHSGMDAMAGAFAYFDFNNNRLVYDKNSLQPDNRNSPHKYHVNSQAFPQGFRTRDNSWINLWTEGQNASIGWKGAKEGTGVKEFGELIGTSRQFSQCMSEQVFELLCLHAPKTDEEIEAVRNISYRFEAQGNYSIKQIFRDTAKFCVKQ